MPLSAEVLNEIHILVRGGFEERDEIAAILSEEMYEPGELNEAEVLAAVNAAFAELDKEKSDWPPITDCDRLNQAFAVLNERGIIALQNAGYTQSDGYDDVRQEYVDHPRREEVIGYCFYHGQDLERVVSGAGLYLAFGPIDPRHEEEKSPLIGAIIVQELAQAGLRAEWDGTFDQRISIPVFDWKRR
jgi:hypothetical protein